MEKFNYQIIAEAIDHLVANYNTPNPNLEALAKRAGYEPTYFQKIFQAQVGLSPKKLLQYMNMRHVRDFLGSGQRTMDVANDTNLSSQGRLYDLCVSVEAATPGEIQKKGEGLIITYGYHATPFGEILIGQTSRGLCWLGFVMEGDKNIPFKKMREYWPKASLVQREVETEGAAWKILKIWQGEETEKLKLNLFGTNFQIQVWKALLQIPEGQFLYYQDIANQIGDVKACRAVGNAVGKNPVSLIIPCHRVIRKSGIIDNYGWGSARKKQLLAMEGLRI